MDDVLIRNIGKAHAYYNAVKSGLTFDQIASNEGMSKRRLLQIIPLAFLAPDITKSIVSGAQPVELTTEWLQRHPLPVDWQEQRSMVANL